MTVKPHDSVEQLQQQARHESRPLVARRIHAVAMAQQGLSSARIAELIGDSSRSVERWVARYNDQGVAGLPDRPRSGRPPKLSAPQQQAFCARVDGGPQEADGVSVMHGKDYQRLLEREFVVMYSLDGVYKLLHRLGYSWLMPRPRHEQADRQAQEDFEKTSAIVCP